MPNPVAGTGSDRARKTRAVVALVLALAGARAPARENDTFFPLMACNEPPADAAALEQMKACGLTVAGFVAPKDLDLCQAAGLKAIVFDPRATAHDWQNLDATAAREKIASLVAEVDRHPAVYGYYLTDEPGSRLFPGLGTVAALVREMAPGKWPYINLFPNYASPAEQLGAADYDAYVERFVATCRPTTLCYDHYALLDDGTLRDGYWRNLESMRAAARKHDLPFWNIVLTAAHFDYREPTAADLRFQVYSTLAYGGRGIAYFTFFAPQVGNYRMAPIDQFGHRTPTWHALRDVNLQVGRLAPTLLQLSSDDVYHFGTPPAGSHGPGERSLLAPGQPPELMAGEFTHADGSRYVLIVNKDPARSHRWAAEFRVAPRAVRMVSPYTGQLIDPGGEQQWLAPGQGTLLRVEMP